MVVDSTMKGYRLLGIRVLGNFQPRLHSDEVTARSPVHPRRR